MMRRNQFTRSSGAGRSGLEDKVISQCKASNVIFLYEGERLAYTVPVKVRSYTPDFKFIKADSIPMYIETKGFWDAEDRKKHFLIKEQYPYLDLRFIFNNPDSKIRKGSKTTYADVCSGNLKGHKDFIVPFAKAGKEQIIPQEWLEEL